LDQKQPDGGKGSSEAGWTKNNLLGKGSSEAGWTKIQPDGGNGSSEAG
jgi:hypothetical protein